MCPAPHREGTDRTVERSPAWHLHRVRKTEEAAIRPGEEQQRARIHLLNGFLRRGRGAERVGRCSACGRDILLDARILYRDGEACHAQCVLDWREDRLG
jgi:hypothetical protein